MRKFLVVVDDSPEFRAALSYACRRAAATEGRVVMLRVVPTPEFEHWSGVRDELRRQQREEAEQLLTRLGAEVLDKTGEHAAFLIKEGDTKAALKQALSEDPDIKILVLAAAVGGRGPGPLVASIAKEGVGFAGRKIPVTVVPGDLTDGEIESLA